MSVVKRAEENLSALDNLLGKDNVEDVKKRIGDLIVDRVRSDMRTYDMYLFYPEDYNETIDVAFEKVSKKITKMYTDAMLESATEAITRFKDIALSSVNDTPGIKLRSCHKCKYINGNRCKFYDMYYWRAHDSICAEEGFTNFCEKDNNETKNDIDFKIVTLKERK